MFQTFALVHVYDVISVRPGRPALTIGRVGSDLINLTVERDLRIFDKIVLVTRIRIVDVETNEVKVRRLIRRWRG